ncbi:HAD family hydrolase [Microbacterium sp. KUDC0406]|uniref:HAD family hydrolase n=1 Tax=Microbacterium sp. KUDC0406 TaxID=2909588 RepID=UPI001F1F4083|nr:HAD-IA family hydrolase [Microbacterium sp. KUDC0406]UJP09936.1 HAD family hydrolase [Microbacterium sp. KUDC0406]
MTNLIMPHGLLVDFGGVIVETTNREGWQAVLARHVHDALEAAGAAARALTLDDIERDIRAGGKADSRWKDAMSRPFAPAELTYREFWEGFVAGDWPTAAREYVRDNARELCRVMGELKQARQTRPGFIEVLDAADAASIPVVIVSNTLMGQVHRDYLIRNDLTSRFAEQIYSDEVRVRKPNPEMIHLGAKAIGETAARCWYVGDNFDRDVLCGVRAGVGGNILMEAKSTYDLPYDLPVEADAIVADPWGLRDLLVASIERAA